MGLGVYVLETLKSAADASENPAHDAFVKKIEAALSRQDVGLTVSAYSVVADAVAEAIDYRDGTSMEALTIATFILVNRTHIEVGRINRD